MSDEKHFNSRPSARGDLHLGHFGTDALFQFTPLREGRPPQKRISTLPLIFQFTPLREGRLGGSRSITDRCHYFNSRPSARGDMMQQPAQPSSNDFNSRPSARGDGVFAN